MQGGPNAEGQRRLLCLDLCCAASLPAPRPRGGTRVGLYQRELGGLRWLHGTGGHVIDGCHVAAGGGLRACVYKTFRSLAPEPRVSCQPFVQKKLAKGQFGI